MVVVGCWFPCFGLASRSLLCIFLESGLSPTIKANHVKPILMPLYLWLLFPLGLYLSCLGNAKSSVSKLVY